MTVILYVLPKHFGSPLEPNIRDLTFVCLCSIEIIRERPQGMPVIQFIKFPTNVEHLVFIVVSEGKTNRKLATISMTLPYSELPFIGFLVLPSHGVNFCPHVPSILIHKRIFNLKKTLELHTSRV